jgi:cytochrome c-type biogenesis protein CcmE|tara:strand:+ start:11999 stop:12442 length:444 start_codon:yes stop_codon:yes gene_type:complete
MKRKNKRLLLVLVSLAVLGVGTTILLSAIEDNLVFFYTPSEIEEKNIKYDQIFRIGGLVVDGTVKHNNNFSSFSVTDLRKTISVTFKGVLPDLFREGQGVIAEGSLRPDGTFTANQVLAKHDETYMPKEVADKLKSSGLWKEKFRKK